MSSQPIQKQASLKRQRGLSMVLVLTFMILAGITALGVYTANKRSFARGSVQSDWQTSEEAVRAGLATAKAWITNDGLDAVGIFQAFYDKYNADEVFVPIKLPLDSFKVGGSKGQDFEVYLTSFNAYSDPMEFTLEIVGKGQNGASTAMSYAFKVDGMYLEITDVTAFMTTPIWDSEYGLFNGGTFNAMNSSFNVIGDVYGGGVLQSNSGASSVITGDLIIGAGGGGSYGNAPLTVEGRLYSLTPFYLNGGAKYTVLKSAWFRGGIEYINDDLVVGEDMIIDTASFYNGGGKDPSKWLAVGGNTWLRYPMTIKGNSAFNGDFIAEEKMTFENNNNMILRGTSVFLDDVESYTSSGGSNIDINNYGDAWFNDSYNNGNDNFDRVINHGTATKENILKSGWVLKGYTGVTYPDTLQFEDMKKKLGESGKHADPFTVDDSVTNAHIRNWSWYWTNACGGECKNSNNFDATNLNAFYRNTPDSVKLQTKDVNGVDMDWIVVNMNGTQYNTPYDTEERLDGNFILVWDGAGASFNTRLPKMLSTSRVMYWFKNGADASGLGLLGTGETCACLIIAEDGSDISISGTQTWKGGFFAMNGANIASNNGSSTFEKDSDVFKDFVVTGLLVQTGSANTYSATRNVDKSLRVDAPTLSVELMGAFKQVKTVEEMEEAGDETIDPKRKVFLSIYPNLVKVGKGAYPTWDSLKHGMNIRALYSYDQERGNDSTISSSQKGCSGNWEGTTLFESVYSMDTTIDFTYEVTCPDHSTIRTGAIIVGTGAGGATSSSSFLVSSSSEDPLSSVTISSSVDVSSTTESSSSQGDSEFCYDLTPQLIKYYSGENRNGGYKENTNEIKGVARQWPNNSHEFTYLQFDVASFKAGDITKATLTMDSDGFAVYGYVDMYLVPAKTATYGYLGSYGAYGFYDENVKFGKTRVTTDPVTITFTPDSLLKWVNDEISGFSRDKGLLIVGAGQYANPGQSDIGLKNFNLELCRGTELSSSVGESSSDGVSSSEGTSSTSEPEYTLTFNANPAAGAVIKCTINGTTYEDKCTGTEGSSVVVNVIETSGYEMKYWEDNNSISALTRTFIMPANDSTFTALLTESSISTCIPAVSGGDYTGSTGACYEYVKASGEGTPFRIGNWSGQSISFKVIDGNGVDYYITSGTGGFTLTAIPDGTLMIYQLSGDGLKYQFGSW